MKKKLIAMAVAGAVAAPLAAQAGDVNVSGFGDVVYTAKNESADNTGGSTGTDNPTQNRFTANGEIDVSGTQGAVTGRIDVDLEIAGNGNVSANGESGRIEQAFASWAINDAVTVLGGVFNNPLGYEQEDVPNMDFVTHNAVWGIMDNQTSLVGNNVAGVAAAFGLGQVDLTAAILNNLRQDDTFADTAEKNSFAINANATPMENLNVEAGFVSQEDFNATKNPNSAGNIFDINANYNYMGFKVGGDYLAPSDVVDSAYTFWGGYDFGNGFGVKVRYDAVSWDTTVFGSSVDDTTATSLYVSYEPAENLSLALEYKNGDNNPATNPAATNVISGINDGDLTQVEIIVTM